MKSDTHNCREEYITELVEDRIKQLHEVGECSGAPVCGDCLDLEDEVEIKKQP